MASQYIRELEGKVGLPNLANENTQEKMFSISMSQILHGTLILKLLVYLKFSWIGHPVPYLAPD